MESLAGDVVAYIMPFITAILSCTDKVDDFLNSTVSEYARQAQARLPLLKEKLNEFRFYLDIFTGVIRDVIALASFKPTCIPPTLSHFPRPRVRP